MIHPNEIVCLEYAGVRLSREKIELRSGGSTIAMVPRQSVRRVSMAYGYTSERPLVQGILGGLLLAASLDPLALIASRLLAGGKLYVETIMIALILIAVGGWLLFNTLRKGPYFRVELEHGQRKFPLAKNVDATTLRTLASAAAAMGYVVDLGGVDQVLKK